MMKFYNYYRVNFIAIPYETKKLTANSKDLKALGVEGVFAINNDDDEPVELLTDSSWVLSDSADAVNCHWRSYQDGVNHHAEDKQPLLSGCRHKIVEWTFGQENHIPGGVFLCLHGYHEKIYFRAYYEQIINTTIKRLCFRKIGGGGLLPEGTIALIIDGKPIVGTKPSIDSPELAAQILVIDLDNHPVENWHNFKLTAVDTDNLYGLAHRTENDDEGIMTLLTRVHVGIASEEEHTNNPFHDNVNH